MLSSDILGLIGYQLLVTNPYYDGRNRSVFFEFGHGHFERHTSDLIAFSMTCRHIRTACMPLLFKCLVITTALPDPAVVEVVSPYIQIAVVVAPELNLHEAYSTLFGQLPQLSELHVHELRTASTGTDSSDWIFRLPRVETVVLHMRYGSELLLTSAFAVPPLREFTMIAPGRLDRLSQLSFEQIIWENAALEYVLDHVRQTLRVLRVPGESMRLSFLSAALWPRLSRLVLFGECPLYDTSWPAVIRVMPALHSFVLDVALPRHATPPMLWPRDVDGSDTTETPALRGLMLTSPRPDDPVFARLPPTLTELSLREAPRYNCYTRSERAQMIRFFPSARHYESTLLSSRGALQIFSVLQGRHIASLELVVREDAFELEMLARVAEACPTLAWFEFHRYRDVPEDHTGDGRRSTPGEGVPTASLALAFSAFRSLRALRLNLDFPLTFHEYTQRDGILQTDYPRAVFVQSQAQIFADNAAWLSTLAIYTRHRREENYWRTWSLQNLPTGVVVLNEEIGRLGPHLSPDDFEMEHKEKGRFRRLVDRLVHRLRG
ncbi:hypothetical protein EXIGLDRAFT_830090 [Exidia glandulosa HHB12029]|uniref:Uncharacterized protein n=1 Tax=Exidia glandulosa HHB12029 TaxID=1314781 RepID=A0A165NX71_EXIGL|nr:hypothetical protein EXIGLDRAFT_830090 [Exidia glandulosa HHB12029]